MLSYCRLSSRVFELYRAGRITAIQPSKVFSVSDLAPAIRYFSSSTRIGKVVVSLDDSSSQITVSNRLQYFDCAYNIKFRPLRHAAVLSPQKSYIMVGCLGGLGRSLSRWMFDRGARYFVFIGRSGADKPSAKKLVEDLQESGAAVVVVKGNVSCLEDVQNAVMESPCPIGGIIQAAMGLNVSICGSPRESLADDHTGSHIYRNEWGFLALWNRRQSPGDLESSYSNGRKR